MKQNPDKRNQTGLILGILAVTLVAMLALFIPAGPRRACLKSQTTLNEARADMVNAPHVALFPSLAIFLTVLAFNLLGDGLRDALDPKIDRT